MSPIPVGFRDFLHEIGPMTRNPERDTERSRVVRARSPSLITITRLYSSRGLKGAPCHFSSHTIDELVPVFFERRQLASIRSCLLERIHLEVVLHFCAKFLEWHTLQ